MESWPNGMLPKEQTQMSKPASQSTVENVVGVKCHHCSGLGFEKVEVMLGKYNYPTCGYCKGKGVLTANDSTQPRAKGE